MRKNSNHFAKMTRCLFIFWCFLVAPAHAAVVNLSWTEDAYSFTSTWRITDNGGGDFSGTDSITGTFWEVEMMTTALPTLTETVGHIMGPHDEGYISSSLDYGPIPLALTTDNSFVLHDYHKDSFSLTSEYVDGGYNISFSGLHTIPIPAAAWLLGSGLGLLGWLRRRA